MSTPITDAFIRELRREGLTVKTVKGWKSRGRPGPYDPRGVLEHHTASNRRSGNAPALGIVTHGRSDLEGPLAQIVIGRDGTVFIVAAGRANHGGAGGPWHGFPEDSANATMIGIENENDGIGEPWPAIQLLSITVVSSVLLRTMKRGVFSLGGHKEWTTRKIDPNGIGMDSFRKRVKKWMRWMKRPLQK